MEPRYRAWLERQNYEPNTIGSRISDVQRIEKIYGDLDEHFDKDRLSSLISIFSYSTDDQRYNRPNPSKIRIDGDIRTGLATCKSAVELYRKFRLTSDASEEADIQIPIGGASEEPLLRFGLEHDMQSSLRREISQLEESLTVADRGVERSVESGRIDIFARDATGGPVVIELKAGVASQGAVAQILSYMGDVLVDDKTNDVRGILIAASFDAKAMSAARMVPNLKLRTYSIKFSFLDV